MKKILDYPNGPVFVEGHAGDILVKVWYGTRSSDLHLTARAARRLALALLLEAERVEASEFHRIVPPKLSRPIELAIDAVVRFHVADEKLRRRKKDRADRAFSAETKRKIAQSRKRD